MKATLVIEDDGKLDEFNFCLMASDTGKKLKAHTLELGMGHMSQVIQTSINDACEKKDPEDLLEDEAYTEMQRNIIIGELNVIGLHQLNSTESN